MPFGVALHKGYFKEEGLNITGLDDPKLKDLKIGVFQTSGIRMALARRGIVDNLAGLRQVGVMPIPTEGS